MLLKPRQMHLPERHEKKSEEQLTLAKLGCCSPANPRLQTALPGPLHCRQSWGHSSRVLNTGWHLHRDVPGGRETDHSTAKCQTPVSNTDHPVRPGRNSFWLCDDLGGLLQLEPQETRTAARVLPWALRDCTYSRTIVRIKGAKLGPTFSSTHVSA